jgi:hypothetical protein
MEYASSAQCKKAGVRRQPFTILSRGRVILRARMPKANAPKNVTLSPGPLQVNLTCYGFHVWSEDYLAAARAYSPVARQGSLVGHFLCCQSIELSLKEFLSLKGVTRRTLEGKPFGHNLERLFDESGQQGLDKFVTLNPSDASTIQIANAWYDIPGHKDDRVVPRDGGPSPHLPIRLARAGGRSPIKAVNRFGQISISPRPSRHPRR